MINFIIDTTACKVSKSTRTYAPVRATVIPYIEDHPLMSASTFFSEYMCSMRALKYSKKCCQCKLHSSFPNCKMKIREWCLLDGTLICDQTR